jgi:uncharacterized protein (TIGR03067 family)
MNDLKTAHPRLDKLEAFGQGRLSQEELISLSSHLDACAECRHMVEASGDDTLISLLRSAATKQDQETLSIPPDPREVPTLAPAAESGATLDLPPELTEHGRYRIQELLGVGGMGAVYKAEHLLMERPVALKVINRSLTKKLEMVERFRREVKAAARLAHPNIVHAYDAEQAGDLHFLVMEYVQGNSLAHVVSERGPLAIAQACNYIRQAALGLQYAHEQGMVHRDIKPHNLMLTPDGQIKILDFGLARFAMETTSAEKLRESAARSSAEGEAASQSLTQVGGVMGTPDYIAPEQVRDAHRADIRADIYSLGCTLYHLLTGHSPYPEGTAIDKIKAHMESLPKPLPELNREVPPALALVVERMLAKEPAQRYRTPAEVAQALQPFIAEAPKKPSRAARRWLAAALVAVLVGFTLLAGSIIYVQTDEGEFVIETKNDQVAVLVNQKGVRIRDEKSGREYLLKVGKKDVRTGQYTIVSELPDGVEIEGGDQFTIKRGGQVVLTAKFRAKADHAQVARSDLERIQGNWRAVYVEENGVKGLFTAFQDDDVKRDLPTLTVEGNHVSWKGHPGGSAVPVEFDGLVHLDPTREPKTIDFSYLGKDGRTMLGIYRVEGDRLTLCWSIEPKKPKDRPTEFATKGKKWTLVVWERAVSAEKVEANVISTSKREARLITSFGAGFKPITRDGITEDGGGWKIDASRERFVRLYELQPPVEECMIYFRAKMKSSNLHGRAYLEMWARMPLGGEYFAKGLTRQVLGTTDWKSVEIPFVLQKDERPDLFKLGIEIHPNALVDQKASASNLPESVWIKDIEIWQAPLPAEMKRPSAVVRASKPGEFGTLVTIPILPVKEGVSSDQKGWRIEASKDRTINLAEHLLTKRPEPTDGYLLTLRAQMKASNLHGKAYLEMTCCFPDDDKKEEAYSRGIQQPLTGTTDWASLETSFRVEKGQPSPEKFKFNLVIEGKGTVWIKDIELLRGPLPK